MSGVKIPASVEALYALIFAICVLLALFLLTSCGHSGVINTVRRAKEITGIDKVYALVGGFHLAPAPPDYLAKVMAEIKTLPPYVIRAKGRIPEEPIDLMGTHPLKSDLVMVEDIYACEAVQAGLESGVAEIGPLSRWEAPMTFFQRQLLDFMPVP